jgi:hypothetical protein
LLLTLSLFIAGLCEDFFVLVDWCFGDGVYFSTTFACGYLAVIDRVATSCSGLSQKPQGANLVKKTEVRKNHLVKDKSRGWENHLVKYKSQGNKPC